MSLGLSALCLPVACWQGHLWSPEEGSTGWSVQSPLQPQESWGVGAHWGAHMSGSWLEKVLPRGCATEPPPYACLWLPTPGSTQECRGAGQPGQVGEPLPEGRAGAGRHRLVRQTPAAAALRIICSSQRRSVHGEDSHAARWAPAGWARLSKRQGAYSLPPQDSWLPCPESPAPWVQRRPLGRVCARSQGSGPSGRGGAATSGPGSCQPLTREFGLGAGGPAGAHPERESPQVRWLSRSRL